MEALKLALEYYPRLPATDSNNLFDFADMLQAYPERENKYLKKPDSLNDNGKS